jgi:hypothetical protein
MGLKTEIGSKGVITTQSAEDLFVITATAQNSFRSVAALATGSLTTETYCFVTPSCLVVLPVDPTPGQKVTIVNVGKTTTAVGVSGTYAINGASTAVNLSGSLFSREFFFVSDSYGWNAGNDGTENGTSGSFTF